MMNVVERMAELAMIAHNGMNLDETGNVPYVVHLHAVVCKLKSWGYTESDDPLTLAVAWGQDLLEDTVAQEQEIIRRSGEFGTCILEGIRLLTFRSPVSVGHPDYGRCRADHIRRVAETASAEILPVEIADRLCNTLVFKRDGSLDQAQDYLNFGQPLFDRTDGLKHAKEIREDFVMTRTLLQPPPWVTTAEDIRSTTVRTFEYYVEDLEKMRAMSPREVKDFKADLVRKGRIYYPD